MDSMNPKHQSWLYSSFLCMLLVFLALGDVCSARAKTDVLHFANGDHLTCEIIKLEKGYLYVKLEYADGTIGMDWSKIVSVETTQSFVVANKLGQRYTGTLKSVVEPTAPEGPEELKVQIAGSSTSEVVPSKEVVEIERTDTSFWQNMHGSLNAGLNYSKQQNRTQYNFQTSELFQRTKWSMASDYQSSFSGGGDVSNLRNDLQLNIARQLRSPRNFYMGLAEFLQSNEQQLDLRMTFGGAVGHVFSHTNNTLMTAYAGADWNREHYSAEATTGQTGDSAEAVIGTQLNFFRFKTTNILADARVYPSLTDLGRVRFDLNTSLKLRIAKDLYWNVGYFLNYDSRPPQNLPKSDYGSTSSVGWTF
jgi:hypothetical protein